MFIFNISVIFVFLTTVVVTKALEHDDGNGRDNSLDLIPSRFPFLVGVISSTFDDDQIVCTGTLITLDFVLTSAFCALRLKPEIKMYHKEPKAELQYRSAASVQVHPSYDSTLRINDLCLIKLTQPFTNYSTVKLSRKVFKKDKAQLECMVVGIGKPLDRGYQMPVLAKYGRTACRTTKTNSSLMDIIGDTWPDFMCAMMIGRDAATQQPCDHGDPLLCYTDRQYGIFSYGYRKKASSSTLTSECRDPFVQSRFLFVNKCIDWIKNTVTKDTVMKDTVNGPAAVVQVLKDEQTVGKTPQYPLKKKTIKANKSFDPGTYAYLVYLTGRPGEQACGGTLVTKTHVLTSAYCTSTLSEIKVTVAINEKQYSKAIYVYVHPYFDDQSLISDISIIVLNEPLYVFEYVRFPKAHKPPTANNTIEQDCVVLSKQHKMDFRFIPIKIEYGPNACKYTKFSDIHDIIRTTWRDFSCGVIEGELENLKGDPLICDGVQYGITSHWYEIQHLTRDKVKVSQVRYLLVNNYCKWIEQIISSSQISGAERLREPPAHAIPAAGLLWIALQYTIM